MIDVFAKIKIMIENRETTQGRVAEQLAIVQGNLSMILAGKSKPSKSLIKLAEIIYGDKKQEHPDPIIKSVITMMESSDPETKRAIFNCAEKEKLLVDLMKEKQNKEAA